MPSCSGGPTGKFGQDNQAGGWITSRLPAYPGNRRELSNGEPSTLIRPAPAIGPRSWQVIQDSAGWISRQLNRGFQNCPMASLPETTFLIRPVSAIGLTLWQDSGGLHFVSLAVVQRWRMPSTNQFSESGPRLHPRVNKYATGGPSDASPISRHPIASRFDCRVPSAPISPHTGLPPPPQFPCHVGEAPVRMLALHR